MEEVLRLSRSRGLPGPAPVDTELSRLLRETEARWHGLFAGDGRRLECERRDAPDDVRVPGTLVAEILDVLLDNARVHGRGTVRLTVRDLDDALAFDVTDEGEVEGDTTRLFDRGHTGDGAGEGIGLALAHDLAVSLGGRLSLTSRRPAGFTLLVPVGQDEPGRAGGRGRR
ncbi:sensor histidine kinase [Streptomyces sp. P9-A2]|uniref:sensor histidine kinase n=1 Tax=Streptomyces sp. P9-A2 TaxID=3072284 RepID=UPI002FCC176C